jgi:hypothetical protein
MRLTSEQVERTLHQFDAQAVPEDHPAAASLNEVFGDHTFFIDGSGLSVIEPVEPTDAAGASATTGQVVKLADWCNDELTQLAPHAPEPTDVVVVLGSSH